ncbi:MAG: hypothetical protein ACK56F_04270, partial [bacterium]
ICEPVNSFFDIRDCAHDDLSGHLVCQLRNHLRLNRQLHIIQRQVVLHLGLIRQDDPLTLLVVLWSASASHHLQHILRTQLDPFALLR